MAFVTFESFMDFIRHLLNEIRSIEFQMDLVWLV